MILRSCNGGLYSAVVLRRQLYVHHWRSRGHHSLGPQNTSRRFSSASPTASNPVKSPTQPAFVTEFKKSLDNLEPRNVNGRTGALANGYHKCLYGFLGRRKDMSSKLSFAPLILSHRQDKSMQLVFNSSQSDPAQADMTLPENGALSKLKKINTWSAVRVRGTIVEKKKPAGVGIQQRGQEKEMVVDDIECLSEFPNDIVVGGENTFRPDQRHLQLRFDKGLRNRLKLREHIVRTLRALCETSKDLREIETPILFKSTPEGAREFLVPTRNAGYAYALPQSPQQYKQILMASGFSGYFQFAKCFRDEDLRADRQPEFTQLDLEFAFHNGTSVMARVEKMVCDLYESLQNSQVVDFTMKEPKRPFPILQYWIAMKNYGTDKPDLRIPEIIQPVAHILPQETKSMLTSISKPKIDVWRFRIKGDAHDARNFVQHFMDSPEGQPFQKNPDGSPGIFIYDPRKPIEGLQALGHEGAESLKRLYAAEYPVEIGFISNHSEQTQSEPLAAKTTLEPSVEPSGTNLSQTEVPSEVAMPSTELRPLRRTSNQATPESFIEGDIIFLQARENSKRFSGGSTALGRLRSAVHKAACTKGLVNIDKEHRYLWVHKFPLFTPNNNVDPGQGGSAGFSATHHPFTAPSTKKDVDRLFTDPLRAKADHYDLVVNGVELGGGSRRIHNAEMQQFVMRDVLKMSEERLEDFSHLFEALRSGCPPHAGFAFGLDRMVAVMSGMESVRDVIVFPKNGKGEDALVKSPRLMTEEQLRTYHLKISGDD